MPNPSVEMTVAGVQNSKDSERLVQSRDVVLSEENVQLFKFSRRQGSFDRPSVGFLEPHLATPTLDDLTFRSAV